jgi:hypothetical protein
MLSIPGKFVDAVLSAPFAPPVCNRSLCILSIGELDAANTSDAFPWTCCMHKYTALEETTSATVAAVQNPVEALAYEWAGKATNCFDLLGSKDSFLTALYEGVAMGAIVAAMDAQASDCSGGCPFLRPLCKGGTCVRPTCNDLTHGTRPFCNRADGIVARLMCSKTCGCSDPLSSLLETGSASGCLSKCSNDRARQQNLGTPDPGSYGGYTCTDARPGSTELMALARFATSKVVADQFKLSSDSSNLWTTLGCFVLNVYNKRLLCDHDGTLAAVGMKSFVAFCPVTCGCMVDRFRNSMKSCPAPCSAMEAPAWNFQNDVPIGDYIEQNGARDPAVSDLTDRLLRAQLPLLPAAPTESEVAAFYETKYGNSIWVYTLNTRLELGGSHSCRDLSNTQLAVANSIIAANVGSGKSLYPQSCSTADTTTCLALLSRSLVFGGIKSSAYAAEETLKYLVASHPCPVKCNACPLDIRASRPPKCFSHLRLSIDGVIGHPLGTYTKMNATNGARPVYKRDGSDPAAYLFYSRESQNWQIVDDYLSPTAVYYSSPERKAGNVFCPDEEAPGAAAGSWPLTIVQAGLP